MDLVHKSKLRQKRVWRIRKKVSGTSDRPRLCVHFSNKHINAQLIDDESGKTLLGLTTYSKDVRENKLRANVDGAKELGKQVAELAKGKGIESVVFDRNGRRYHGSVKAFADAAREGGLTF